MDNIYLGNTEITEADLLGSLLNRHPAPSSLVLTAASDVQIDLSWTLGSGAVPHRIYISTDNVTFTEKGTVLAGVNTYSATGLNNYTRYYFKVVAYSGSIESDPATADTYTLYSIMLDKIGTGLDETSFSYLTLSANITLVATGTVKFVVSGSEESTITLTSGSSKSFVCKVNNGSGKIIFSDITKLTTWGVPNVGGGLISGINAATLTVDVSKMVSLTKTQIGSSLGIVTLNGRYANTLTSLILTSSGVHYANFDFTGNSNIDVLSLQNWRTDKISSAIMLTILDQLTNRAGSLPSTITINDYADYASPPQSVVDAVAALKTAKPNVTTVNLGF